MTAAVKLENYRDKKKGKTKPEPVWNPPSLDALPDSIRMIGIDQSLGAFGMVQFEIADGVLTILRAHKIVTPPADDGHAGNLRRTVEIYQKLCHLFYTQYRPWNGNCKIAHEAPPASGPKIQRPESSLLAGAAVHIAASELNLTLEPMADPRAHAKYMTNNANASKPDRRKALPYVMEGLGVQNAHKIKNEALRDAFSVGLYTAHRLGGQS